MIPTALASLLLATSAGMAAADDPRATLTAALEACRNVNNARYHALYQVRDGADPRDIEGEVAFVRWPPETDEPPPPPPKPNIDGSIPATPLRAPKIDRMFRADLRVELSGGDDRIITVNRDDAMGLDRAERKLLVVAVADGGEKLLTGDSTVLLVDTPLLRPEALQKMLAPGNTLEARPREAVTGVTCDVVVVHLPRLNGTTEITSTFWLGADDHLPRRTVFAQSTDGKETLRHTLTISDLQVNVRMNAGQFTQVAPEGYATERLKPQSPKMLEKGQAAPNFTLKDAQGKDVSLRDFKGKVVVLDFWGTWCGPCQMAMPAIQKVHEKYRDKGVVVIGISCREKAGADPAKMMRDKGCDYGLLLNGEKITSDWHVPGYPTLYVIDQQGRIAHAELGFDRDLEEKLGEQIESLLKSP